ncbi:MAG: hypothetical protein JRF20_00390 [Deltaproteobacteria bacterium]|nr:hypothetical protein [Deltaproteobacteria bacterium]MBW1931576.1 hypothetical protein [Deltaproteobacteria bacterium]MBW1937439.1 hypothetical protein [Deltaproteobacteria bacterium]MBW1964955.1 hypothetical protein [Deltaproteobacteria bacterium]MBW2080418.1 hypothetical protein [Deltaproteobacteria bacterium]
MILSVLVLPNLLIGLSASGLRKNAAISKFIIPFDVIGEEVEITIQSIYIDISKNQKGVYYDWKKEK